MCCWLVAGCSRHVNSAARRLMQPHAVPVNKSINILFAGEMCGLMTLSQMQGMHKETCCSSMIKQASSSLESLPLFQAEVLLLVE